MDIELSRRFLNNLMQVPSAQIFEGRTALLAGIPINVKSSLNRSSNPFVDLSNLIDQLGGLGRLVDTGERPLIILAQNALTQLENTSAGNSLQAIINELEDYYGGSSKPTADIPSEPEVLIFDGRDERLPFAFIQNAYSLGKKVARLVIPRIFNEIDSTSRYFGTGWLISSDLLVTNHHVINARDKGEPDANDKDFRAQANQAIIWFEYYLEGGEHIAKRCIELVHSNSELDYAILRITADVNGPGSLSVVREHPPLTKGTRLNIVQYPQGGPIRFAIRNNFYVGTGNHPSRLRYLTDTEPGSSGSPVFNDNWQVIAMHRGYQVVSKEAHQGEVIRYHNEGIAIHAILNSFPPSILNEITIAQGWK